MTLKFILGRIRVIINDFQIILLTKSALLIIGMRTLSVKLHLVIQYVDVSLQLGVKFLYKMLLMLQSGGAEFCHP